MRHVIQKKGKARKPSVHFVTPDLLPFDRIVGIAITLAG
jgi:hypothetical protein